MGNVIILLIIKGNVKKFEFMMNIVIYFSPTTNTLLITCIVLI